MAHNYEHNFCMFYFWRIKNGREKNSDMQYFVMLFLVYHIIRRHVNLYFIELICR
jgi:hypothetical protein